MSAQGRRKDSSLAARLSAEPQAFAFYQAVCLLERLALLTDKSKQPVATQPVARFAVPAQEAVRFRTRQSFQFPTSEIYEIRRATEKSGRQQWNMVVGMMSLGGAMGVLPHHYTELALQRLKEKDPGLLHFLDLFAHRTISLFFQAGCKYRLAVEYQRRKIQPDTFNRQHTHTRSLLALIGLGTNHLSANLYTRDESLVFYGGLLSQTVRSTTGLTQILRHHFGVPVHVRQFIGRWQELIEDARSRLPWPGDKKGRNVRLGKSVTLGAHGWLAQGKIRIVLGPLNHRQFETFTPGSKALEALNEIIRFYVGMEVDYDFLVRVKRSDVPMRIQLNSERKPVIGWNTWLSGMRSLEYGTDETVDIHVSARSVQ